MHTPICDFVKEYAQRDALRLHMPGHKGKSLLGLEEWDLTEIEGADVLYAASGIIKESEDHATELFGSGRTIYSTEGSSLGIRSMLYLAMAYGKTQGKRPHILAGRNAHKTFMTAAALLDLEVSWLLPKGEETLLSCKITETDLETALASMEEKPVAVYLTNPDYLGNMVDLRPLAQVCHRYGVLLLVDNAHGAYLHFLPQPCHPMDQGADLCCDSAHKTLPVLTGGAYLHIAKDAPEIIHQQGEFAMSLFASTSPSYLILQSLDQGNVYLAHGYREKLSAFLPRIALLKEHLEQKGFQIVGEEGLKLTLAPKSFGYTGTEIAQLLEQEAIVCEFSDWDYVVMMLTPELTQRDMERLERILMSLDPRKPILQQTPKLPVVKKRLSIRQALFSASRELPVVQCRGKIMAGAGITCPPAIPIVICGEEITAEAIACMEYYGITTCRVVT